MESVPESEADKMKPFQQAYHDPLLVLIDGKWKQLKLKEAIADLQENMSTFFNRKVTWKEAKQQFKANAKEMENTEIWMNDIYQVQKRDSGDFWYLSIKRLDKEPIHDWRHLQQIKNEIVGPENEGLELYPAESRLVDTANQYHMWVLKEEGLRVPVGFNDGRHVTEKEAPRTKQRPFGEE
jgi:hypothetical protein